MKKVLTFLIFCIFTGCTLIESSKETVYEDEIFLPENIIRLMKKAFNYQIDNPSNFKPRKRYTYNGWIPSVFYTGVMAAYQTTKDPEYLNQALEWAESNEWKPAPNFRSADDVACGQTYIELYLQKKDPQMIGPIKARLDSIMAHPRPGREDWDWCDALFMAPPVFAMLAVAKGETKYIDFLNEMFWDATDFLFDKEESLYFRDKKFFDKKTKSGKKVFWSRGNGWVMAGIIRVLKYLPEDDPYSKKYIRLLQTMSAKISELQGKDGFWRTSLLAPEEYPDPETSGTGFFCYALARGINQGFLDRETYLPIVKKAWKGLVGTVHPNGKVGWVQPIGKKPWKVSKNDTYPYGIGAFLLAASEMINL